MPDNKSLTRVEAFSDGIFAIAITLLILEIKVPPSNSIHSTSDLFHALAQLWPSYFAFLYSFGAILVQWVVHHNMFQHLDRSSRPFLYTNAFLLLTIVFFPFPTALLAEYINTKFAMPAIFFYNMVSVINSAAWFLFIRSINKPRRLLKSAFSPEDYQKLKTSNHIGFVVYLSSALLALWMPFVALGLNIILWIRWIYVSLMEREEVITSESQVMQHP